MGVKIDGRQIHHLRFADDIVLITPGISQEERMLAEFDRACGRNGLRLNLTKTMPMRNGLVSYAPFTLNGMNISKFSSYAYLGREINVMNDLAPELCRRKRGAWGVFKKTRTKKHSTPCPPFQLNGTSCPNVYVRNLVAA
uniref:Reverse transcriptase domain-containing protein n=1 Tax=Angiostrongylus cantonensis TaxID=6313 RepID=A0A0K0D6M5_ANGCA